MAVVLIILPCIFSIEYNGHNMRLIVRQGIPYLNKPPDEVGDRPFGAPAGINKTYLIR